MAEIVGGQIVKVDPSKRARKDTVMKVEEQIIRGNICKKCGGQIVAEYIGTYGDVYLIGKSGNPHKKRFKRHIYEHDGDTPMIYCKDCGEGYVKCGEDGRQAMFMIWNGYEQI